MFLLPHSVGGTTLLRKLGTGGVAESYLGTQEGGRQVVVRRLLPFVLRDPARLASIEARILDLLGVRHPFLVHVLDHLTEGEEQYIVEEYVHGVTLEQVLTWCRQSGHIVPHNVFLNVATQICNGLEALHGRTGKGSSAEHVLHLSLKPSSIFLSTEGKVLVGGYGLTRSPTTFPQGGVAAPVPARMEYLSPEQTHPDQKLTPASDVFALGAVLYELLTLESLFRAESNLQTIHRVRRAEVTAPLLKVKERMPGLDKVLFRALSLNPRHRYQRAFVLREDLRGLMAGYSFATISEDTRAFLHPILEGAAAPVTAGYVVGLDDAPESPAGADAFGDSPNTRIDPDPMSTAAQAAAALAERVARERAAEAAPERTERTDVNPEGDLTPLPKPVALAPVPTPIPPMPTASPTWSPEPEPDTLRDVPPPGATVPEATISTSAPVLPPTMEASLPAAVPPAAAAPPEPAPEPPPLLPARPGEIAPSSTGAFLAAGKGRKRKDRSATPPASAFDPPSAEVARTASPTLAPAPAPFTPPVSADAPLPAMSAGEAVAVPPVPATKPTLAPESQAEGPATVARPAPAPVYPPPLPAAEPEPPPAPKPGARLASVPPPTASLPPAPRAEGPSPFDPLDEPPPANRGPLFAGVTLAGLAAVLLCAGVGYWGYGQYSAAAPELPVALTPPVVAPPEEDPASVLAATAPEATKPADAAAATKPAEPPATPAPEAAKPAPEPVKVEPPKPAPEPPKPAPEPPKPAPVVKAEPAPKPVVKAEPKPAPKPEPVVKAEPKPVAKAEPVAKPAPKPAPAASTSRTAAKPVVVAPPPDASLAVTDEPASPSLDGYVADARNGRLSTVDVAALEDTPSTDPNFTRSRALLLMNAQKKGDDAAVHKYLDSALSLPENQYNPVFLAEYARWHVNRGEYDKALEKAGKAERYWARLPSDLIFTKKAEIYEVEAAAWQGKFYKSGEDLELLENAVHGWEKYRAHVATKDRQDLVKKADEQLTKLNDTRSRLQ